MKADTIITERLELIPAARELVKADLEDRGVFSALLHADIPPHPGLPGS
jgi:hypothetical protein